MSNQWGLGLNLISVTIFFIATTTNTCLGVQNSTVACFAHERLALLEFKHSVQDSFDMLSSWVGNDCCRWQRVHCDNVTRHVERLNLRAGLTNIYNSYDGREEYLVGNEVKSCLAKLSELKYLDLSGNFFRSSRIPKFIGSFKQLAYLNLSYADFSGNIPNHIGNLSNLKVLDISYNYPPLIANDMAWISGLSSLKYLDLSSINLSHAENYDMMFHMIQLEELNLAGCGIFGNINLFNSSSTLSSIKHLNLGRNHFKGVNLGFFQNMTSLEFLDLSGYDLSRSWDFAHLLNNIPSLLEVHFLNCGLRNMHLSPTHLNFSSLSNIQLLDLRLNSFEGSFPFVLTNLSSLIVLDLSGCKLNSSVPVMPNLLELDLSRNNFKKIEQLGIWRQCHLRQLSVSYNYFDIEMIDSPTTNLSECSQYALERLYLEGNFIGTILKAIGTLTNLKTLDLSSNRLTGPIPKSLVRLKLLEELDLSNNQLNSSIPESLGRLRLLKILDLSYNQLNGIIPESLGRLVTLKGLILRNNHLVGPIPTSLGRLVSLQIFSVSSNLLNETIPASLGKLAKLHTLYISNNVFEGVVSEAHFDNLPMLKHLIASSNNKLTFNFSIEWIPPFQLTRLDLRSCRIIDEFPSWLRTQRKLIVLALSNNSISGPLPTWLREMPVIHFLDLSHNQLSGPLTNLPNGGTYVAFGEELLNGLYLQYNLFNESIPLSLCRRTNLEFLNLSRNNLTGKIPTCLGNLQKLITMIFSSNGLSGVIPSSISHHFSSLRWLNLNDNNFVGDLPLELGNLGGLIVLDLGDNKFSGNIPEWIGEKLSQLVFFRVHKNNFTGRIPLSLCNNTNLQILDVAHNNFTGLIPRCLGRLKGMVTSTNEDHIHSYFDYDELIIQVIKGVGLEYTSTSKFVINMDLSGNKLVGEIPTELTALVSLVGLNLSNNLLSGCIPDDIGNMDALNSLDFSGNQLTGMIPPSMASLHFLSNLNLSHNNLSGRIPIGNQLQTLNEPSIYAGNKDLCGDPLPKKCSTDEDLRTAHNKTPDEPKILWFYLDVACGFATGFWGIIGVLVFKKEWRQKLFTFAEVTMDKIYVAVVIRVAKMKRQN